MKSRVQWTQKLFFPKIYIPKCIQIDIINTKTTKSIDDLTNGYTPTLGARGGEGSRRVTHGSKSVTGVRGGVFTEDYIKDGRKAKGV